MERIAQTQVYKSTFYVPSELFLENELSLKNRYNISPTHKLLTYFYLTINFTVLNFHCQPEPSVSLPHNRREWPKCSPVSTCPVARFRLSV